jgi:3-hydroxyisobutyrate dehydrogenase-like beta-hydroxyacid dehydrogenase
MVAKRKGAVGIVGLGIMGGAFAKNLAAAGWRVVGYDLDRARGKTAARAGAIVVDNVTDLIRNVPVLIRSLPNPGALQATVQAIVEANVTRRVLVEASTFALEDKLAAERALRKAGHVALDCPISGTGSQAKTKDLVVYASGDSKTIARLRPLFAGFSRAVHDVGAFGNGSRIKYVANLLVAINNVATAEAMVLGMKAGLPPQQIFDLVKSGAGNSRVFELRGPMMVEGRYDDATMKVSIWQKDMDVISRFAEQLGAPTPLLRATLPIYARAMVTGHAAEDTASVCAVLEQMAGLKRSKSQKKAR